MEILDDTQYEPDEQFYLKLSLTGTKTGKQQDVVLGRISIMEVTVLNDDGQSTNQRKIIHMPQHWPFFSLRGA